MALSTGKKILLGVGLVIVAAILVLSIEAISGVIGASLGYREIGRAMGRAIGLGIFLGAVIGGSRGQLK